MEEIEALDTRLARAEMSANDRGCAEVVQRFAGSVRSSKAVINRSLNKTYALVASDDTLFATFYDLVGAGLRRAQPKPIETARQLADTILFPNYNKEIRFAALSLSNRGVVSFGDCSIILRDESIASRSTVFEENSVSFCARHELGVKRLDPPPGYRATWDDRPKLVVAKLADQLGPNTIDSDFQDILLTSGGPNGEDQFVEVHIYGALHRSSVEQLRIAPPKQVGDEALCAAIVDELEQLGVTVERGT